MPGLVYNRGATPSRVLMPLPKLVSIDGNQYLQIMGSQEVTQGTAVGKFVTESGLSDMPGASDRLNGANGSSGWTPVFAPEQDGTRSLLRVTDWMGGTGAKPQTGLYLAPGGYVPAKANAFNFNIAKRIENHNIRTGAGSNYALTFTEPFTVPPRVLPAAIGSVSGRPNQAVATNITATGCTIETYRLRASLLSLGGALLDAVSGVDVDVLVVEA